MKRRTFIMSAPLALAACGGRAMREEILAPQADIDRVAYVHPGPKSKVFFPQFLFPRTLYQIPALVSRCGKNILHSSQKFM